jgi:hypothetical protein
MNPQFKKRPDTLAFDNALSAMQIIESCESVILKSGRPDTMIKYAVKVRKGRWPEAEPYLAKLASTELLEQYISHCEGTRLPLFESRMVKECSLRDLVKYARRCVPDRWYELEQRLLSEGQTWQMAWYIFSGDRGRWPEVESRLVGTLWEKQYAQEVLPGCWDEEVAKTCSCWLYYYAKDVIGGRLPDELHNHMMCFGMVKADWCTKTYLGSKKYQ